MIALVHQVVGAAGVAPDHLGLGLSGRPPEAVYTPEAHAIRLRAFVEGLSADEHPFIGLLSQDLVDGGIAPVALRVP